MATVEETRKALLDTPPIRENESGELVLSLESFRKRPRHIELIDAASGDVVSVKIPGSLSLRQMIEFWQIEDQLIADGMTDLAAVPLLRDLEVEIQAIIQRTNPGVDITLDLDPRQAVALFGFLARPNDSMAALFIEALRGGVEKLDGTNDADAPDASGGDPTEGGGDAAVTPLRSGKRSSGRSSGSERSTAGRRSGGSPPAARGTRSAPTSPTPDKRSGDAKN